MASDEKPTSLWKKEISFRRKPERAVPAAAEPANEPPSPTATPATSVWKKEISLRKKRKDAQPAPVAQEAVVEAPQPEPDLYTLLPELLELVEAPEPEPVAAKPEQLPAIEHSWLTQPLEEVSEPPAEPVELAGEAAPPEAAAVDDVPDLDLGLPAELELPPVEAVVELLPELPPEVLADALGQEPAVHPAHGAAEPAEAKVPFYKRELSLGRFSQRREPRRERARQPEPERATAAEAGKKVPFYKRELSLKRAPKQWDVAEPEQAPKAGKLKQTRSKIAKAPRETKPKLRRPPRPKPSLPSVSRGPGGKKLVGLKIGGSQIAAARVINGAAPELVQAVREPLEHGIVVGGELRDPDALAVALKDFFQRHKLPKRGVRLGIANNRIGVRTFEVVGIDDPRQLANAIRFRAQEVLPIPLEEAVLDYQVLAEFVNDEGQPVRRVLLVVAYRELVDRYVHACRKAGLQIVGIDLEAFALLRAVAEPRDPGPGSERAALVAVSVGHDRSTFAVSDGRTCEFTRVLEWGGWALNIAIARALDMAPSEVEQIKRGLSFAGAAELPGGGSEEQLVAAREAAKKQLQAFARELVSSLQFYQNQPGSLGIGEIALTGGTAHLPGLGAELERLIGVPVRVADPLTRLRVSKKLREREQIGSLAVAIGLGIED